MNAQESIMTSLRSAAIVELRKRAGDSPVSVLVDPLLDDPLAKLCDGQALDHRATRVRIPRIHDDIDPARSPYLLHAPTGVDDERLIEASVDVAVREATSAYGADYRGRSLCAWVTGDEPHAFARRLSAAARIVRPRGSRWPLRLWDPRVLPHLPRVLPARQWRAVEALAQDWMFVDALGRITSVPKMNAADHPPGQTPLRIDATTWSGLTRIGPVNQTLALASKWGMRCDDALICRIDRAIAPCHGYGFSGEQDALVFATCAVVSHERFDEHPAVARLITGAQPPRPPLASLVASIDDDTWKDIRSGRWLEGKH